MRLWCSPGVGSRRATRHPAAGVLRAGRHWAFDTEAGMAKRALVVGINDYSVWTAGVPIGDAVWSAPSLSCCVADADSFAQVLKDGFQFDEIVNLRDAQATSQSIQDNIR